MDLVLVFQVILLAAVVAVIAIVIGGGTYKERPGRDSSASPLP